MKHIQDYVPFLIKDPFEFGLVLTESALIQVTVVDHEQYMVRTLGTAASLEEAFQMAQNCIQRGFYLNGLFFTGIPSYKLNLNERIG